MKKTIISSIIAATIITCSYKTVLAQSMDPDFAHSFGNRATDSLSLIKLNQSTRGDLWKEKWDFSRPLEEWYGVSLNKDGRVFCLDLDGDPSCTALRHGGNHLHGSLTNLQLPFLEHLFLSSNKLEGPIPDFSGIPYLRTLQLSANNFSGTIPEFERLTNVIKIDLEYNQLCGPIPQFEYSPKLAALYLGHNRLSGSVPSLYYCIELKQIYLEHNQLEECPQKFDHLIELRQFLLCRNQLNGPVPIFESNNSLKLLDLSDNKYDGCINYDFYDHIEDFRIDRNNIYDCLEEENMESFNIVPYPNPTTATISINLKNPIIEDFQLYTAEMKKIEVNIYSINNVISIDLENLNPGLYLLKYKKAIIKVIKS